ANLRYRSAPNQRLSWREEERADGGGCLGQARIGEPSCSHCASTSEQKISLRLRGGIRCTVYNPLADAKPPTSGARGAERMGENVAERRALVVGRGSGRDARRNGGQSP